MSLDSLLRSIKAKPKVLAGLCPSLVALGRNRFQFHSNFWLNSVPCTCRTEIPFPCQLLVKDWYLILEAACTPFHAFQMVPNISGRAIFLLLMSLTPPFTTSLLPPDRWSSLLVRAQMIIFGHLDNWEKSPYFKVSNFDHICKVPLSL